MSYQYLLAGTTYASGTSFVYGPGTSFTGNTSYTVRGFTPNYLSKVPTSLDNRYHSSKYFNNILPSSSNPTNVLIEQWYISLSGGTTSLDNIQQAVNSSGGATQPWVPGTPSALYGYSQSSLDKRIQFGNTNGSFGVGNFSYTIQDVTGNGTYITGLSLPATSTMIIAATSDSKQFYSYANNYSFIENVLSPWGFAASNSFASRPILAGSTYYFQMAVWGYPGSGTVDINNSNITFSDGWGSSLSIAFNGTSLISNSNPFNASKSIIIYPSGTVITGGVGFNSSATNNNFTVRIDAGSVSNYIDLTQLQKVGFAGKTISGSASLKVSNLKFVSSSYGNYGAGIQSKIGIMQQEIWPQITQQTIPPIVQTNYAAYNYTYVTKFNSGHNVGSSTPNQFSLYLRVNPKDFTDYIKVQFKSSTSGSQISAWDRGSISGTQIIQEYGPTLSNTTDYVLLTYLYQNTIRIELWSFINGSLQTLVFATNNYITQTTSTQNTGGGYFGYDFTPNIGDFSIDYMYAKDIILAEYTSKTFNSALPVAGVSIYANTSSPDNIIRFVNLNNQSITNLAQDASYFVDNLNIGTNEMDINATYQTQVTATNDPSRIPSVENSINSNGQTVVFNPASISYKVTKNILNANIAGATYTGNPTSNSIYPLTSSIQINNTRSMTVKGYLLYDGILDQTTQNSLISSLNGQPGAFRVVLWDKYFKNILFIQQIQNLVAGEWNEFKVDINADIYETEIQLEIQHVGTGKVNATGSFWLNNVQVLYRGINWEASSNNGLTWTPFYNNTNSAYAGVRFANDVYKPLIIEDNPAIYWKLDESSGTVATNYSSYGTINNGTYGGTSLITYQSAGITSIATDFLSYGKRFAGSSIPGNVFLKSATGLSTAAVSAETWIRTNNTIPQTIIANAPNLLSDTNSHFETGMTWAATGNNPTLAQSAAIAYDGIYSLAVTTTTASTFATVQSNNTGGLISVIPGQTYTVSAWIYTSSNSRRCSVGINWFSSSIFGGVNSLTAGQWTNVKFTAVAPAGVTTAAAQIQITTVSGNLSIGEIFYIDNVSFTQITNGTWSFSTNGIVAGTTSPTAWWQLNETSGVIGRNLLGSADAHFETGIGNWYPEANCSIYASNAQAYDGTASLAVRSIAAGNFWTQTPYPTNYVAIPGQTYTASCWVRADSIPRSCQLRIEFLNGATVLTDNFSVATTDSTTGWTQLQVTATAPANTTYYNVAFWVYGAAAGLEIHYIDNVSFSPVYNNAFDWSSNGYNGVASTTGILAGSSGPAISNITQTSAYFNGSNAQIVANPSGLTNTNTTIVGWFKINGNSGGPVIAVGADYLGGNGDGFSFGVGNGSYDALGTSLTALFAGKRWIPTTVGISTATWHHGAMVLNNSGYPSLYLDGQLVYSDSTGTASNPSGGSVYIGHDNTNGASVRWFTGNIAQTAIFPAALSSADIYNMYKNTNISGKLQFAITGVGTVIGTANYFNDSEQTLFAPATANWNYLVGTYDGNNIDIYRNGILLNRVYNSTAGSVSINSGLTVIGPISGYRYQDETSVYPYALTGQQVLRHYNAGISSYNQLKIRARAYTEDSWIKNYEVTPHYAKPGRLLGS